MRQPTEVEAIGLALAGYTFWVLADASMKLAGGSPMPAYEIVGLIGAFEVGVLLTAAAVMGRLGSLRPRAPGRQAVRSCLDLANNLCVVVAVRHLPLALFYLLVFLAPTVTAVLAAVLLRESIGWKQWLALLTGFGGVVIAVGPLRGIEAGAWMGYGACLVCVLCFSANMVWSRKLTQTESPQSLVFCSGLVMAVAGACGSMAGAAHVSLRLSGVLLAAALCCVLGSSCFFLALKHTKAALVSQFHYSQLVTGALVAYLGWHERPSLFMFAGAVLIVAAGVYTASSVSRSDGLPVQVLNP